MSVAFGARAASSRDDACGWCRSLPINTNIGVWQWEKTVTAGNSLVAPRDATLYTVQFMPDGALYIRADCNSGRGTYELVGESLTVGPLALTRAACAPGSLSEPFVGQIAGAVSLHVGEVELTVGLPDGSTMTFTAQE